MIPAANDADGFRKTGDFSSFSVPAVSATASMLISKSRSEPALDSAFRKPTGNCLMKAILLNSARKLPYWHKGKLTPEDDNTVPLDYLQGAGMLDAYSAYRHLTAGRSQPGSVSRTSWDKNYISRDNPSAEKIYHLNIDDPNEQFVTVTLCWNYHYQKDFPFKELPEKNTDLLLEIWAADANDPNNYKLIDYSDSPKDNTEHIFCKLDADYTQYDIIVARNPYHDSDSPPDEQNFAITWNVSNPDIKPNESWYDLNCDGKTDKSDVEVLMENLIKSRAETENLGYLLGDINGNSKIDIEDLQQFAQKIFQPDTPEQSSANQ